MATVDTHVWDETVCNMMACQHPPCWETLWRIESGHPRIVPRAPDPSQRQSPEYEEELPTLKILDLPLNYSQRERIKCSGSLASLSKTISSIREARRYLSNSTLDEALLPRTSVLSSEKNPFPGLNSRMESHTPYLSAMSFWRPAEKIQVTDLGAFAADEMDFPPACANVFQWIPDRRPRHLQLEKSRARAAMSRERLCVKELALEGILSCKDNPKVRAKKSNKVPTGGQPYLLHLKKNRPLPGHKASPGGRGGHCQENSTRLRPPSPGQLCLVPVRSLPKAAIQAPEASRALPESKEKFLPSLAVQKEPNLYTPGAKVPVKEKDARRMLRQIRAPFGGLALGQCPMPALAEPPDGADPRGREGGSHPRRAQHLPLETASDNRTPRAAPRAASPPQYPEECRLQVPSPGGPLRRRRSVRFVEYKSNTTRLCMEGCDGFAPRLSRAETQYSQYCQHLASRKETGPLAPEEPPAPDTEPWPTEAAQEPEEDPLPELSSPPGQPPPPPPSPLISENSDHPLA